MEKQWDITALGELLVDFTPAGVSAGGMKLFEQNPGGAPANMLASAASCGLNTVFIGAVGDDLHGHFLKNALQNAGVSAQGLQLRGDAFTTLAFVDLSPTGERSFAFARKPGADTQIDFAQIDRSLLTQTRMLHIGSLSLTDEPAADATVQAVKLAKANGAIISYDPNYRAPLWRSADEAAQKMRSLIAQADMMKISDEEAPLLTPYADPQKAAEYLLSCGVQIAAVTLGAQGVLAACREGAVRVPAFACKVVDTTGAGDSFWGAFAAEFLKLGVPPCQAQLSQLAQCARYANAVAALCVQRRGGITGIPSREETLAFLRRADEEAQAQ